MAELKCVVVTPERTALDQEASFVVVPLFDGELGIGAGHSPLIGRLGYGEMRVRSSNGQTERLYVDGGFVQVVDNVITVLTGRVIPADKVDAEVAREQLRAAMQRPANTEELMQLRDRAVEQARSQIRMAQRGKRA
jgi:F-type H+-transporting ATPase subunit epsilon